MTVRCGVPQGSILGPLLFILYVNDICNVSDTLNLILFADDTSVFMSHKNLQQLQQNFNTEFQKIVNWLNVNKLVLNLNKTHYMIFTNKVIDNNDVLISVNDTPIQRVRHVNFLGVLIDDKIKWNEHIGVICNRLSRNVGVLNKIKSLPRDVLVMLYNTLIQPHLNYCIIAWACTSDQNLTRLLRLQKRAMRIISHSDIHAHSTPLFCHLKILNIYDLFEFQVALFMYQCYHGLLPSSLLEYFNLNQTIHKYQTRNASNFHFQQIRTALFRNSVFFKGPKIWNSTPTLIKQSPTLNCFKRRYKQYLLENYTVQ